MSTPGDRPVTEPPRKTARGAAAFRKAWRLQRRYVGRVARRVGVYDELNAVRRRAVATTRRSSKWIAQGHTDTLRNAWRLQRRFVGRVTRRVGVYDELNAVRRRVLATKWQPSKSIAQVVHKRRLRPLHRAFNGVTVIIPTYRLNEYVFRAINSVLHQDAPKRLVDVIVCVNGDDEAYYKTLVRRYAAQRRVEVVYVREKGPSVARNFALRYVRRDLVSYLDDDDYFTRGYLSQMMRAMTPEVELVCGRVEDERAGVRGRDNYLNRSLAACPPEGRTSDYMRVGSLLSTVWAKLYRTEFVRARYAPFDEQMGHTEDVQFWVENFRNLKLPIACLPAEGSEALVRSITADSTSRPRDEIAYSFWVTERLRIIARMESMIFNRDLSVAHKRFVLVKIKSQADQMWQYFRSLDAERQDRARAEILDAKTTFVNLSSLASTRGIAFCHNFAPFADASAYVAAKRLQQVSGLVGEPVAWHVVSADMRRMRSRDDLFNMFFVRQRIDSLTTIPGPAYFNEQAQHRWAEQAAAQTVDLQASVIYSRSMFAGSHEAAYQYKRAHPDAIWYAEFSDPIYLDTNGEFRQVAKCYEGEDAWLNDYWRLVEGYAYEAADHIIFTNRNQREVMLALADRELVGRARAHSMVLTHPRLERRWADVVPADYEVDKGYVNVGFFGTFYANRKAEELLALLGNPWVCLHLFVPDPATVDVPAHDRIRLQKAVDHLRFLSIAASLDYLVINDVRYPGPLNPYIPSKLADYLATGTKVIALVEEGSMLAGLEDDQIICVRDSADILGSLS